MKNISTIFVFLLLMSSCKAKDIIDFNDGDDDFFGDVDSLPFAPANETSNYNSFLVPKKPIGSQKPNSNYVSNVYFKPSSFGLYERKRKVLKAAKNANTETKRSFIKKIGLELAAQNSKLLEYNYTISQLKNKLKSRKQLTQSEAAWLKKLANKYKFVSFNPNSLVDLNYLDTRVGVIPESLGIAQAAIESSWGKSRFSRQGNNYFGQWCFRKGCGMVPARRDKGKIHEVKSFKSPAEAVEAYIHNLNTHSAYKNFRLARKNLGAKASGYKLSNYLDKYSAKGSKYGEIVRSIIKKNNLE